MVEWNAYVITVMSFRIRYCVGDFLASQEGCAAVPQRGGHYDSWIHRPCCHRRSDGIGVSKPFTKRLHTLLLY